MLFVLCQICGEAFDAQGGIGHNCNPSSYSGDCEDCGHYGTDMRYDSSIASYYHKEPRTCIRLLREEITHTGSHCLENDDRYCKLEQKITGLEKTIMEFVEGRRAAVEATIEKRQQPKHWIKANAMSEPNIMKNARFNSDPCKVENSIVDKETILRDNRNDV